MPTERSPELAAAIAERDEILIAMDQTRAKEFVKRHGGYAPKGLDWEKVMHLARFEVTTIPEALKTDSHIWLARNVGMSLATLPHNSQYARAAIDLIFPKTLTDATIAEMATKS